MSSDKRWMCPRCGRRARSLFLGQGQVCKICAAELMGRDSSGAGEQEHGNNGHQC